MGTVWQARDEVLERDVAVKEVILPGGVADADRVVLRERTLREARATARLNHPNIVTMHDVFDEAGRPWIVMEFLRARSLQDIVDADGPLPPRRAAEVGRQTLAALRAAHDIGVLHRDVKPGNVLITDSDRAVLTDFGIAYVEGDTTLTRTGLIIGSPATLHIPYGHGGSPELTGRPDVVPGRGPGRPIGRSGAPRGLLVTIGVLAAAVVVLTGFLIYRSVADGKAPPGASGPTAPARAARGASTAAEPRLPAGWHRASGPGYTIGVPAGWRRSVQGRSVFWRDPASAAYLQVDRTPWAGRPDEAWERWESEVLAKGTLEHYTRVDLRRVAGTSYEAADIEFTWTGRGGRLMHGVDRRVLVNGRRYAVFIAIPADQWQTSQARVTGFLNGFRP
jgi:hypothetical protein